MMNRTIIIAALVAVSAGASAQLYEQLPHAPGADGGNGLSTVESAALGLDRQLADDFLVTDAAGWNVTHVRIFGVHFSGGEGTNPNFNVRFFQGGPPTGNDNGSPNYINVASTYSLGPGVYFGREEQRHDIATPTTLSAGTWFVSIEPIQDGNYFQLTSTPTSQFGSEGYLRDPVGPLYPNEWTSFSTYDAGVFGGHDVAFAVYGEVVPEPASMLILGAGLAALLARRRRKKA